MDMNNINPFLNNAIQNDDISLLETANEENRNDRIYHDIIPISFADHSVISGGDISTVGHSLYPGASSDVSSGQGELYRMIPEMLTYDTFAEESLNTLLPAKAQGNEDHCQFLVKTPAHSNVGLRPHQGKDITNLQHQSPVTHDVAISGGHQTNLAALFEAPSSETIIANSVSELTHRSDPTPDHPASPIATRHER